jgi:hypothetical protein
VSLGEALDEKTWTVRVYVKPFVDWIWGGALLMALGGLLALSDRRYRVEVREDEPVADLAAPWQVGCTGMAPDGPREGALFLPLAGFALLALLLGVGLRPEAARGAVALHRQAGTGVLAAATAPAAAALAPADMQGQVWLLNVWASGARPAAKSTRCW